MSRLTAPSLPKLFELMKRAIPALGLVRSAGVVLAAPFVTPGLCQPGAYAVGAAVFPVPTPSQTIVIDGDLTVTDMLLTTEDTWLIVRNGAIRLTGSARWVVRNSIIDVTSTDPDAVYKGRLFVEDTATVEAESSIFGGLGEASGLEEVELFTNEIMNASDDAQVQMTNSFITALSFSGNAIGNIAGSFIGQEPLGGLGVEQQADVTIEDSIVTAVPLGLAALDVPITIDNLQPGYLDHWSAKEDISSALSYDLILQRTIVKDNSTGYEGGIEMGWNVAVDSDDDVTISNSRLNKLSISFASGEDVSISGLRIRSPIDFDYRSVRLRETEIQTQWGIWLNDGPAVFTDSQGLWLNMVGGSAPVTVIDSHINELDPRDGYTGTLLLVNATWSGGYEIWPASDLAIRGSVRMFRTPPFLFPDAVMTRTYDVQLVNDANGEAWPGVPLVLTKDGSPVWSATTDATGSVSFDVPFDEDVDDTTWVLQATDPVIDLQWVLSIRASNPIRISLERAADGSRYAPVVHVAAGASHFPHGPFPYGTREKPYPSIQEAIENAGDGVIRVGPGTHGANATPGSTMRRIELSDDVFLLGGGAGQSRIDADIFAEDSDRFQLSGFELQGDVEFLNSSGRLTNNVVAGRTGNGIACVGSTLEIINNVVSGNGQNGIALAGTCAADIRNNIIVDNELFGIAGDTSASATVDYNAISGNQQPWSGPGVHPSGHNIFADPLFRVPGENYRLQHGSPCIDAGDPALAYQDSDGTRNDMGAFGGPLGQSGDVVIETDTQWPEGTYALDSLTIDGATLRVAGGSSLDVTETIAIVHDGALVLEAKNTDAMVDGAWRGVGVRVRAADVTVETGSAISADGQGYLGTAGPGAGASEVRCALATAGGGGGHGGAGGVAPSFGAAGGGRYDAATAPVDLGSGGGNNPGCGATSTANAGGGAILLEVDGVLQLDGAITADAAVAPLRLGGGAGGSIQVTTNVLTGTGSFSADGASGGNAFAGGGGGGRIAVYYADAPSFSGFAAATANGGGGAGTGQSGEPGTIAFVDTSVSNGHLHVYQQLDFGVDSALTYDAITLEIGATLLVGGGSLLDIGGEIALEEGSSLVLASKNSSALVAGRWQGEGVTVRADTLTVRSGSAVSADGQGYIGTAGPGAGESDVRCGGNTAGGGGGYGGAGGNAAFGALGGAAYGSPGVPTDLGSGGGNNPGCNVISTENAGGGIVALDIRGVLQLEGTISADGAAPLPGRLGGGAGGSIRVSTHRLTGSGFFSASGADGGSEAAGGGAGGRVAVTYVEAPSFLGFITSRADGGTGFHRGQPGTVAFFQSGTGAPHLRVFRDLVFPADSELVYDAITLENGAILRVGGGSTVSVGGELSLGGNSTLLLESKNRSEQVAGAWQGEGVIINAADVTVESGSTISADGQGYVGTAGPGPGASEPSCALLTAGAGGGYGGAGGGAAFGALGGRPYGSPETPSDLGSGGGNNAACGAASTENAGGGAVGMMVTHTLRLDGSISADAAAATARLGGGAGGSIHVVTATLTGAGWFSADGAGGGNESAGGGGGGRIAVYSAAGAGFGGPIASTVLGGGGFAAGAPGTIRFIDTICDGDCSDDGRVTIDELIRAVNIALGALAVSQCEAADSDDDGRVAIDDLIRAVNRALAGCSGQDEARGPVPGVRESIATGGLILGGSKDAHSMKRCVLMEDAAMDERADDVVRAAGHLSPGRSAPERTHPAPDQDL